MRVLFALGLLGLVGCSSLLGLDGTPADDDDDVQSSSSSSSSSGDNGGSSGEVGSGSSGQQGSSGGTSGTSGTGGTSGASGTNVVCIDGYSPSRGACDDLRMWTHASEELASNPDAEDRFGAALAVSADGSTMAVGAYREGSASKVINGSGGDNDAPASGAVYIFRKEGGAWTQQAYLKTTDSVAQAFFGWAVALSADGNTLVASAKNPNFTVIGPGPDRARAYVFTREGIVWQQRQVLRSDDANEGDQFGSSVAVSGDGNVLAIGGIGGGGDGGFVYTYQRDGDSWVRGPKLTEPYSNAFGGAVALSHDGGVLLVGDHTEDSAGRGVGATPGDDGVTFSGAVSLFARNGANYTRSVFIKASNASAQAWFGRSLAISSDANTFVVGAPRERTESAGIGDAPDGGGTLEQSGAVYIFRREGTSWRETFVKAANARSLARFGQHVAIAANGSTVLVGAPGESSNAVNVGGDPSNDTAPNRGAAYVFSLDSQAEWQQRAYLKPAVVGTNFEFGVSVGLIGNGSEALVGSIDQGRNRPFGSVNVYLGTPP